MIGFKIEYTIDNFSGILDVNWDNFPVNSKIGVYFLYDEDKRITYIGKSVSTIRGRLNNHLCQSTPSPYDECRNERILNIRKTIKYFSYVEVPKEFVDMIERFMINKYKPIHNIQFNYQ
jgi:excinuclease UvrABC nuclease subunit